jgi:predicted RNase H-like HicB family nuclease
MKNIMMKVQVIIERGVDGTYDANMEFIKNIQFGLLGQGKTVSEAIEDFYNSYGEIKAMYQAEGNVCPELEFEFKYDMPSFLQYYAYAFTLAGLERITGVNQRQLSHYINGVKKPGEKTVRKIESRVHVFSNELSSVRFI